MTATASSSPRWCNYANYDLEAVKTMYAQQHVIPGLSDGGAHVAFISDASFPTFLFSYWGRDARMAGCRSPIWCAGRRGSRRGSPGLLDRGVLAPGMKADINVIDFPNLALERPEMVVDLPAGGRRLMQKARGYVATVKAGRSPTGTAWRRALCRAGWCADRRRGDRGDERARLDAVKATRYLHAQVPRKRPRIAADWCVGVFSAPLRGPFRPTDASAGGALSWIHATDRSRCSAW